MSEFDNINALRFQKIDIKRDKAKKQAAPEGMEDVEYTDFSNPKAESLGRSQVSKPDNVENDVKFMMKNPEFCAKANMFFDNAYEIFKQNNEEHAYEKSAQMLSAFKDEFLMLK
ncbi:hypothetical protein IJ843_07235 [bacterium]|nr:hypothetical protein [bacterium]